MIKVARVRRGGRAVHAGLVGDRGGGGDDDGGSGVDVKIQVKRGEVGARLERGGTRVGAGLEPGLG